MQNSAPDRIVIGLAGALYAWPFVAAWGDPTLSAIADWLTWLNKWLEEGLGALFGAMIGLFAVALAGWLGFRQLKAGYKLQAELDREARVEQARQAEELAARRRDEEMRAVAAALAGEVEIITQQWEGFVSAADEIAKDFETGVRAGRLDPSKPFPALLPHAIEPIVLQATAGRLGILEAVLVHELFAAHALMAHWRDLIADMQHMPFGDGIGSLRNNARHIEKQFPVVRRAIRLLDRAAGVAEADDPGPAAD